MKNSHITFLKSVLKLYCVEKVTLNRYKIARIQRIDAKKIVIYISPSDFNLVTDKRIVADKVDYLKSLLQEAGLTPVYLVRESLNSSEAIPLTFLFKTKSILKPTLRINILAGMYLTRALSKFINRFARKELKISKNLLSNFLVTSLEQSIKVLSPQSILTIGATQELLFVGKRLGIPVVEIMHGVIHEEGIKQMWQGEKRLKPDLVITWHEHYTNMLAKNELRAVSLGYPSKPVERKEMQEVGCIKILVTLGHSHPESADPYGILDRQLMNQVLKIVNGNVKLRFRMHPVIDSDKLINKKMTNWLNKAFSNPDIHSPREKSLWESLNGVDLHLSKSSSTFFEAGLLNIPTIFTDNIEKLELPEEVLKSGIVCQGGNLEWNDLNEILQYEFVTNFRFINKQEFLDLF